MLLIADAAVSTAGTSCAPVKIIDGGAAEAVDVMHAALIASSSAAPERDVMVFRDGMEASPEWWTNRNGGQTATKRRRLQSPTL
jgi:hypothetical protein